MKESYKLAFIASSGGHLEQLSMLRPLMERYDSFVITEKTPYQPSHFCDRSYQLRQVNRHEPLFIFKLIGNTFSSLRIFLKEKPDMVISTGALAVIPFCLISKVLFRRKFIFIESFAKVTTPTLTGRLLYRFADRFYVQWEPMLEVYPDAIYLGGIY